MDIIEIAAKFFQAKEKFAEANLKIANSQDSKDWQDYLAARNEYALTKQQLALARCEEYVANYDIGCIANLSDSKETIFQSDQSLFLIFRAVSNTFSLTDTYKDLGIAIIQFQNFIISRSQCFNEDLLSNHPLFSKGLDECLGVGEVINSLWIKQILEHNIFEQSNNITKLKHLIFILNGSIFECITQNLVVSFSQNSYQEILNEIFNKSIK